MEPVEDYILGKTPGDFRVESSEDNRQVATAIVGQCEHKLLIASRTLDPAIYDTREFLDAIKALALRSRYSEIRILISDPQAVKLRGHRLLALAQKLSTFIHVRKPGPEHASFNEAMLVGDDTGYIRRQLADRYEGSASFSNRPEATELTRRFNALWDKAAPDSDLQRLHL